MNKMYLKLAELRSPLLITGETGTGKSYLTRKIHLISSYKNEKYIEVNLATISENLLESELFGHVKGAFTNATGDRKGYCELVGKGTLFLDEVAELSLQAQKKLLLLLEEKVYVPVGSCHRKRFMGRIIAATNRNLELMVENGTFRKDLYYRLMVFNHCLRPVRENEELLRELVLGIFKEYCDLLGKTNLIFENECFEYLLKYDWPGNIREIRNCIEYLVYFSEHVAGMQNLPEQIRKQEYSLNKTHVYRQTGKNPLNYREALDMFEEQYLNYTLRYYSGKVNMTAREIAMSKSTLISKVKKYGINIWEIKAESNNNANRLLKNAS